MKLKLSGILMFIFPLFVFSQKMDFYIGTYTENTASEGIYKYSFDPNTGDVEFVNSIRTPNPSFLSKSGDRLLAVNELGNGKGGLSLFDISNGQMVFLDSAGTGGDHPCHVITNKNGTVVLVSNYSGGSLATFGLAHDRRKIIAQEVLAYGGSGPNKDRQNAPHIHSAFFDQQDLIYVSDLGTDQIYIYRLDLSSGAGFSIKLGEVSVVNTLLGGGPRHLDFHHAGNTLYSLQELTGQLAVFQKEGDEWTLKQVLSIFGDGYEGQQGAADVKISPDGKYVYATNRGEANVIVLYEVLPNGLLEWKEQYPTKGSGPRNFNFSPDGNFLLVANQQSNEVVIFQRDQVTGELIDTGKRIAVPAPVCIVF